MTLPEGPLPKAERITKPYTIADREIQFQAFTEAQYMQLAYESATFRKEGTDGDRRRKSLDRIFRIFRSLIVSDEDKEYIEDKMADGVVDMTDVMNVVKDLVLDTKETEQPKVRRGARQTQRR